MFLPALSFEHNSWMSKHTRPTRACQWMAVTALFTVLAAAQAQVVREPAPGILLVAAESMADPRFSRSVVLVIEHDRTGSWGVILNKPTDIGIGEVLPSIELPGEQPKIRFGGPVEIDRLVFLYRNGGTPGDAETGLPGVHWSDSPEVLEERLARSPGQLQIYAGYAGWAPGQLSFELAHGGWQMIPGRAENVFSDDPARLWRRLTNALSGISI